MKIVVEYISGVEGDESLPVCRSCAQTRESSLQANSTRTVILRTNPSADALVNYEFDLFAPMSIVATPPSSSYANDCINYAYACVPLMMLLMLLLLLLLLKY